MLTIAALIAAVLATVIIISCYRGAKIPPDEKEDHEKYLSDLRVNNTGELVTNDTIIDELGYHEKPKKQTGLERWFGI